MTVHVTFRNGVTAPFIVPVDILAKDFLVLVEQDYHSPIKSFWIQR